MRAVECLMRAKDLLREEARWTKGRMAKSKDENGAWRAVSAGNSAADCWCAYGALLRVSKGDDEAVGQAHYHLAKAVGHYSLVDFNDSPLTSHADLMLAFDKAIQSAAGVTP